MGFLLTYFLSLFITIYLLAHFFLSKKIQILTALLLSLVFIFYLDVFRGVLSFAISNALFREIALFSNPAFFPKSLMIISDF